MFIHSFNHLGVSEKNVREIMSAATFLKITPIIKGCEKILEENMDSSNCISAWKLAQSKHFKNNTLEYIRQNFEKVKKKFQFVWYCFSLINYNSFYRIRFLKRQSFWIWIIQK